MYSMRRGQKACVRKFTRAGEKNSMVYYTSDLHLGHENVIEMCRRPFASIDEMDEALIYNWNKRVHRDDTVWILGDLMFRAQKPPAEYLGRLKGKKRLILGNHDASWTGEVELSDWFESVDRLAVIQTGNGKATLWHFPMLDGEGRYLIHGHIHNTTTQPYWNVLKQSERALNAGVDIHGYRPVTLPELIAGNKKFKLEH